MPDRDTSKNPWLERIPDLEKGARFPSVKPEDAVEFFAAFLAAGQDAILGVIDTLREIDDGKDWNARFLLSAAAVETGAPGKKDARAGVESIYARELEADRPAGVKTFLAMQLGRFAGAASIGALASQLGVEDVALVDAAAGALVSIGKPAVPALTKAKGKAGEHGRVAIDHALVQIERMG